MSDNPFHDHLEVCAQCMNNPFGLCPEGASAEADIKKRLFEEGLDDFHRSMDQEFIVKALDSDRRCSGCGETPCVPDSRGCCPNRPDQEFDLSWGDYEHDEDLP